MVRSAPQPRALLGWIESLADPTRLRLLRLLERQELGVAELCAVLQSPQSTVSRHLKLLADHGWVRWRRQGTTNLYRMILDELEAAARRLWLVARAETAAWPALQQDQVRLAQILRQRQEDAQAFFAGAAGQWDKLRGQLYGQAFSTAAFLALLPRHWTVADLGCGTGSAAAQLAPFVKSVIGVDQSEAMLKAARKRTAGLGNVELRRGDLEAVPIADAAVDAALLMLVLTYVTDPSAVLREAARIVRPGGALVIVDLLQHDRDDFRRQMGQRLLGFAPTDLQRQLRETGWLDPTCRALASDPQTKGPALLLARATRPAAT